VNRLHANTALRPFDLLKGGFNFWMAFVRSPEAGTSLLYDMALERKGPLQGAEIVEAVRPEPAPRPPTPLPPFTLAEMIWELGLPTPADAALTPASARTRWPTQFGPAISGRVSDPVFAEWKALHDRGLANERDSAFGISNGQRPGLDRPTAHRVPGLHPLRATEDDLDELLVNITHKGTAIGATWGPGGKDRGLVYVLLGGARDGGAQFNHTTRDEKMLIAGSLRPEEDVRLDEVDVGGTKQLELIPYSVPAKPSVEVQATVAHEVAHALGLLDEYGERMTIPADQIDTLKPSGNTLDANELAKSAADPTLDPAKLGKIKWLWPRVSAAGAGTTATLQGAASAARLGGGVSAGSLRRAGDARDRRARRRPRARRRRAGRRGRRAAGQEPRALRGRRGARRCARRRRRAGVRRRDRRAAVRAAARRVSGRRPAGAARRSAVARRDRARGPRGDARAARVHARAAAGGGDSADRRRSRLDSRARLRLGHRRAGFRADRRPSGRTPQRARVPGHA